MSDPVMISLIVGVQGVLTTALGLVIAQRNRGQSAREHGETKLLIEVTQKQLNGRLEQLLMAARAEGRQSQRDETRQDAKDAKRDALEMRQSNDAI